MYHELFTKTEKVMIAKRLQLLFFLQDGIPPYRIARKLHISPSTVARFQHAYIRGDFVHTTTWLSRAKLPSKVLRLFSDILEIHFGNLPSPRRRKISR